MAPKQGCRIIMPGNYPGAKPACTQPEYGRPGDSVDTADYNSTVYHAPNNSNQSLLQKSAPTLKNKTGFRQSQTIREHTICDRYWFEKIPGFRPGISNTNGCSGTGFLPDTKPGNTVV